MVAWIASRLAGTAVRCLGGSPDTVDAVRLGVAAAGSLVDPIGGTIAIGHAAADSAARGGNPHAKIANRVLTVGAILTGGVDLPTPGELSDIA